MRFEKLETLLRVALDMRGNAEGLSLADIERDYGVSRRTAERMRDAIERVFPQMEQANPGELPKRWRIRAGALSNLIGISAEELAAVNTALGLMRRDDLAEPLARLQTLSAKLKAMIRPDAARRIGPDLEILAEAEGMALRPGPRQTIAPDIVAGLRHAILACAKVQLHYRARGTGALSRTLVCPYGFLYGNRHYLVADSLNQQARGFRLFSLANIEKVEPTARAFTRRKAFPCKNSPSARSARSRRNRSMLSGAFRRKPLPTRGSFCFIRRRQFEDQPDGSLIVRFRAGGALEMCWHLFTWGDEVEVIEPRRLRTMLTHLAGVVADHAVDRAVQRRTSH